MSQPLDLEQHGSSPDRTPSCHIPHPHPHPHPAYPLPHPSTPAAATTSTPTPTPSPPPPPSHFPSPSSSSSSSSSSVSTEAGGVCRQVAGQQLQQLRDVVQRGDSSGLRRLLEAREGKLNVDVLDAEGQSALHRCCQRGDLQLVKLLVRFGADVRLANRDGWSAVHIAAYGGHTDILLFLLTAASVACRRS